MRHRPAIEFYRDAAARFQLLADIEPWPDLRVRYRQLAAQYRARVALQLRLQGKEQPVRQHAAYAWRAREKPAVRSMPLTRAPAPPSGVLSPICGHPVVPRNRGRVTEGRAEGWKAAAARISRGCASIARRPSAIARLCWPRHR